MKSVVMFLEENTMSKPVIKPPSVNKSSVVYYNKANPEHPPTTSSYQKSVDTYKNATARLLPKPSLQKKLNKPVI
ncbi:MAG: hypothetical protein ACOCZ5_00810 [bacterium]